jgi:hypothetical protein
MRFWAASVSGWNHMIIKTSSNSNIYSVLTKDLRGFSFLFSKDPLIRLTQDLNPRRAGPVGAAMGTTASRLSGCDVFASCYPASVRRHRSYFGRSIRRPPHRTRIMASVSTRMGGKGHKSCKKLDGIRYDLIRHDGGAPPPHLHRSPSTRVTGFPS